MLNHIMTFEEHHQKISVNEARERVKIKRELRQTGIDFNNMETTEQLRKRRGNINDC